MSTVNDKSTFEEFRKRCEDKDTLQSKGSLYAGTGNKETTTGGRGICVTTATPSPQENSLLIKDETKESGLNWKPVEDVLNDASNAGQNTSVKNVEETIKNVEIISFFKQQLLELVYPVGSIYMSTTDNSPQDFLGGTWVRWGQGRVPAGISEDDSDFQGTEKIGGEKSTTLTIDNIPYHRHTSIYDTTAATFAVGSLVDSGASSPVFKSSVAPNCFVVTRTGTSGSLDKYYNATTGHSGKLNPDAMSNLQPYITCYMWKRTA